VCKEGEAGGDCVCNRLRSVRVHVFTMYGPTTAAASCKSRHSQSTGFLSISLMEGDDLDHVSSKIALSNLEVSFPSVTIILCHE